jgi:conjugative relaxase-like TrwC/TraI family protein
MLTLARISSGEAAASYYEQDDYYSENGRAPSAWYGRGAAALGLAGEVDRDTFRRALDGHLPSGIVLASGQSGARRSGWDLTFSAPKSVSMQALIAGDQRLITAHEKAVEEALRFVEKRIAGYRETVNGDVTRALSDKVLIARFQHDLSRNADPQLHTHAVLVNATVRADGQWRALDAKALYRHQLVIGAVYRAELAREIRELGHDIRVEHTDGRFELAHITRTEIEAFSSRSAEITAQLAEGGRDRASATAREREVAALNSRGAKQEFDRATLRESWLEKAVELGLDFLPQPAPQPSDGDRQRAITEAVDFAIAHTTERSAVVQHSQLVGAALGHGVGRISLDNVEAELAARVGSRELIQEGSSYTSAEAQAVERQILEIEVRGRNTIHAIVGHASFRGTEDDYLNHDQRDAAHRLLTSVDRVVGLQGGAGTGKTTLLRYAQQAASEQGYAVRGVAPSAVATRELGTANIASETVASFITRRPKLEPRTLLILDEAGMVGSRDMRAILTAVEESGARIVLVGDTNQLKAVAAGAPFEQLQRAGMTTAQLEEVVRQRDPILRNAVQLAARGETSVAVRHLGGVTAEFDTATARWAAIARQYGVLAPEQRSETLIVSGTNRAREEINNAVRVRLGLAGAGHVVSTLQTRDLTEAQRRTTTSYAVGDVVEALRSYKSIGLSRGDRATVVGQEPGRLRLQRTDGSIFTWRPVTTPSVTVYRLAEREFAAGDQIRVTANDYNRGMLNGDVFTVVNIDPSRFLITLRADDGRTLALPTSEPVHIEHGYCTTVHAAQGRTVDRVIVDADTRSATSHEASFYVAISRARNEAWIYTDDRESLPAAMSREDHKSNALDIERTRDLKSEGAAL